MTKITREEVLKIARMSQINIHENEIPTLIKQLEEVLSYAERVQEIATADSQAPLIKNVNVMREDTVVCQDPAPLLAEAPVREGNYFVVPMILESNT